MSIPTYDWSRIQNLKIRGKNRIATLVMKVKGKKVYRSLHIEADPAGKNAKVIQEAIRAAKVAIARDSFAILRLTKSTDDHATLGAVIDAYRLAVSGSRTASATAEKNILRLARLIRDVKGETFNILTARSSILTHDLADKFHAGRIRQVKKRAEAEKWPREELDQAIAHAETTAKSTLQQARSIFAAKFLSTAPYRALNLPDLTDFLAYKIDASTLSRFKPWPAASLAAILADVPQLRIKHPARWLATILAANTGMRRSSARAARWDWFTVFPDGSAEVEIRVAKGNNSLVTLSAETWAAIKAERQDLRKYVIPGETDADRDAVITAVVDWIRSHGITPEICRIPYHHLRKMFGDRMAQTHGLEASRSALGHSTDYLTKTTYSGSIRTKAVDVV